ncbi:MAG: Sua5/YciO/YrdC/YwlC family protein [Gammaproteobacteria bacterium]|nr:Sua5/YciO/YrdC/YwlC family protein [Gammaproteobacteria bacterium]
MASALQLAAAARALAAGGIIAYPTEGVWGLGCDAYNAGAVSRLLQLKRRDWRKGLIVVGADFEQLRPLLRAPSRSALRRALAGWPGPITWVFPAAPAAPPWLTGAHGSIAVRVTAHAVAGGLCRAFGAPIVSTSANRSGQPPATGAAAVRRRFGDALAAVVPGALGGLSRPTPVRDAVSGALLRR